MRYRKLDPDGDYSYGHSSADFFRDEPPAPAQSVLTRLRLFTQEWFLDLAAGTKYNPEVLGKYTMDSWQREIQKRIRQTPGVLSLDVFNATYDRESRTAHVEAEITTVYGVTSVNQQIPVNLPMYGQ